jgi:hypothetical protein
MADNTTKVDVLSLEDFNKTLVTRLGEAEALLAKLNNALKGKSPALGTFQDGSATAEQYTGLYQDYVQRIGRLKSAITAAQTATTTILSNYHTTEARNHANATDIAGQLSGIATTLDGGGSTGG